MYIKAVLLSFAVLACSNSIAADKLVGDASKGKALYGGCSGCHGADGMGNAGLQAPRLAGQKAWYTVTQLKNFKAGIRGTVEGDVGGAMMRPMASMLPDNQAIADVAAYLESL